MSKFFYTYLFVVETLLLLSGCKKPYAPSVTTATNSFLVVEGMINTGADSTIIHIAHTIPLSAPTGTLPPPELNAGVVVESDANATYPLTDAGNGYYVSSGLNLSATNKYRLKITTSGNTVYESDFVPVKNSPPIDSVNYMFNSDGLDIHVSTHDPSNSTRYYRWSYDETWIIHSNFDSFEELHKVPFDTILPRPLEDQIYQCWQNHRSNVIVLGSTAALTQDIISQTKLTSIATGSEKVANRYSILVKQYALTPDAFNYWQQLKKNTEQLGSIFDPQPSEIQGNIHSVSNPSESVVGYISAGSVSQKRIFIDIRDLPSWPPITDNGCKTDTLLFVGKGGNNEVRDFLYLENQIPISSITLRPGGPIIGYSAGTPECVDCTLRGSNKPPAFWTNQ